MMPSSDPAMLLSSAPAGWDNILSGTSPAVQGSAEEVYTEERK